MSSKSHIRVRVRATVRPRAPPRSGDATRTKKFASRDVADADPRPRASFARAVPSLSLSLSLFPRATLASRAEAARRARVSRGRDAASSRSRDDAVGRPTTRAREARSRGGRRPSMDDFERARRDARAFARRVDGSRSSHRVVRTLDGVAPRARGRVVVASTESNARASPSSVSSLTTGCPPSANQSNRSRDPERRRARSTPRVAARSRCVRVRVRPIHRLDSTRTRDRPPARPSERNSNRHPDRRRASVRPPSTPPLDRPNARSIDRSIDRRASLVSRLAVESDRFLSHALPFIPPRRRKQSSEKPPRRRATHSCMHRRLAHALVCVLVGFRNPAPRVPSRHRASTRERFTNRIDPSRVRHQSSRATDGRGCSAPRWGHTHTTVCDSSTDDTHTTHARITPTPRSGRMEGTTITTHDSRLVHSTHRSTRLDSDDDVVRAVGMRRGICLLYTSPSPRDATLSRMPSSA